MMLRDEWMDVVDYATGIFCWIELKWDCGRVVLRFCLRRLERRLLIVC